MALAHGQNLHRVRQVALAAVYLVQPISIFYVSSDTPLMTGTGEQIIRTALARDLCERADPNTCEDTLSGIERGFKLFSGM